VLFLKLNLTSIDCHLSNNNNNKNHNFATAAAAIIL